MVICDLSSLVQKVRSKQLKQDTWQNRINGGRSHMTKSCENFTWNDSFPKMSVSLTKFSLYVVIIFCRKKRGGRGCLYSHIIFATSYPCNILLFSDISYANWSTDLDLSQNQSKFSRINTSYIEFVISIPHFYRASTLNSRKESENLDIITGMTFM